MRIVGLLWVLFLGSYSMAGVNEIQNVVFLGSGDSGDVGDPVGEVVLGVYQTEGRTGFRNREFSILKWAEEVQFKTALAFRNRSGRLLYSNRFSLLLKKRTGNKFVGRGSFSFVSDLGSVCTGSIDIELHPYSKGAYIREVSPQGFRDFGRGNCVPEASISKVHEDPYLIVDEH